MLLLDEEELFKQPQQPHPQPLSKGEGSDMLQDTLSSTNNAAAKTPAEHSTPLSFGEGAGVRLLA